MSRKDYNDRWQCKALATSRQRRCGKVMLAVVSVSHSVWRWSHVTNVTHVTILPTMRFTSPYRDPPVPLCTRTPPSPYTNPRHGHDQLGPHCTGVRSLTPSTYSVKLVQLGPHCTRIPHPRHVQTYSL